MSKTLKITLLAITVLVIAVGGWIYYLFNIRTYNTEDAAVREVTDTEYSIDLPVLNKQPDVVDSNKENNNTDPADEAEEGNGNLDIGTTQKEQSTSNNRTENRSSINKDTSNPSTEPSPSDNEPSKVSSETDSTANEDVKSSNESKSESPNANTGSDLNKGTNSNKLTATEINRQYRPAFESLESQATSRLNNLLARAYNEYREKKDNGDKISYSYFYQKYTSAADQLEANTDKAFQQLYQALQSDLKANGFSSNAASEFKEEYEAAKENRKDVILNKVQDIL